MNGIEIKKEVSFKLDDNTISLIAEIDINDWKGGEAVQALTNVEVTPLQMETYKSFKKADDFCKDGTFSANSANYLELSPGDIVYGKFKAVSILKPTAGEYNIRLIRGV